MAVEVCHDAWRQVATLYCNTSDTAFGPIFTGPTAGTEAEDFLDWLREMGKRTGVCTNRFSDDGTDPRDYSNERLAVVIGIWRRQYEPAVPEPQSLRVDYEEGRIQDMTDTDDVPVYGPGYPQWAAKHERDETRRDLACELLRVEFELAEFKKLFVKAERRAETAEAKLRRLREDGLEDREPDGYRLDSGRVIPTDR